MKAKPLSETQLVTIEDGSFRVGLDQSTGWIRSLIWKPSGTDLFAQIRRPIEGYIGGIRIFDEVARRWYDDFDNDFRLRWVRKKKTLAFEKRFRGAPFVARVEFSLRKGVLEWDVELRQAPGQKRNRQVKVVFFLPLIAGWDVWAPAVHMPFTFDGMSSFEFMYNQGPYYGDREIMLPVLSHYNAKLDAGYTVCEHLGRNIPASKFQFANGRTHFNWSQYFSVPNWQDYPYLEVVHSYIGMRGLNPCRTGIQLFPHGGDWRPGLGKVVARHKEFFFPPEDAIWDRAGVFHCGGVQTVSELERSRALGMKYLEVHGHFPWYGDYFHEEAPEWESIGTLENRRLNRTADPNVQNVPKLSQARIEKALAAFKQHGVSPHYYINFSDGYRDEVEKRWPGSIARQEDGKPAASGWHFCHLMNPDPQGAFGRHLLKNAAAALARYPQLDGFFLDCFRHFEFDFGADDGVTLANNRPAYNVSWGLGKFQEALAKLLAKCRNVPLTLPSPQGGEGGVRGRNLDCFANKPRTAQTMRFVDGVLLEGQGEAEEAKWFWLCLAKPIFYMWGALTKPEEEYLKRSVVLGGWPKLPSGNWRQNDREFDFQKRLYGAYLPLYEHFRRRVVCFEPNPVEFSDGLYGQLYTRPDGAFVAGAMTDWTSVFDEGGRKVVAPYIAFRLKDAGSLGDVQVHYAGEAAPRQVDYYRTPDGLLVVDLPAFRTAAVVVLKPGAGSRNLCVKKLRDTHDYCGDPTSAFEFGSGAKE